MGVWVMLYGVSMFCVLDLGQSSVVEEFGCGFGKVQNGSGNNICCCSLYVLGKVRRRVGFRLQSSVFFDIYMRRLGIGYM